MVRIEKPQFLQPSESGSASSKALRLSEGRDDPELLHHAESVPADVRIHDLSIDDVIDGDSFYVHFLVCGGNSHEFAGVSAGNCPSDRQLFLFVNDVFNREAQIRNADDEARDLAFISVGTNRGIREVGIVESVAGGDDFVD